MVVLLNVIYYATAYFITMLTIYLVTNIQGYDSEYKLTEAKGKKCCSFFA